MKKGIMRFDEYVYSEVNAEELLPLIIELEDKRDPSDGTPLEIAPEVDDTYTVIKKVWVSSEWEGDE